MHALSKQTILIKELFFDKEGTAFATVDLSNHAERVENTRYPAHISLAKQKNMRWQDLGLMAVGIDRPGGWDFNEDEGWYYNKHLGLYKTPLQWRTHVIPSTHMTDNKREK